MLTGLRHDALVGRHDQHGDVDSPHAGQHVLHEALVTGHVDDLDREPAGLLQKGEAEVDGDPSGLLFGQPVGVDTGQGLDEGGLAVIDVPRGADDDVFGHDGRGSRARYLL